MNIQQALLCFLLFSAISVTVKAQQPPAESGPTAESQNLAKAATSSIFIYTSNIDPCGQPPPNSIFLPLGSGFVIGITQKNTSAPGRWHGWKYLITAKHVVDNQSNAIIRLNYATERAFKCYPLAIASGGQNFNVFLAPPGIDIAAIALPDIPETDPAVFDASSLVLDEAKMKNENIGVGTQVFTVGYVYGYSGVKANYPVTKFGEISLLTDESGLPIRKVT